MGAEGGDRSRLINQDIHYKAVDAAASAAVIVGQ